MNANRRSFLRTSAALAVAPALSLTPTAAFALPTLSASAVSAAKSALINLHKKTTAHTATPTDVQAVATSLGILFGNMHESGFNSAIVGPLRTDLRAQLNKGNPDTSQKIRALLASNGIDITSAQAEYYFHLPAVQVEHILSQLSSPGLYAMELAFATNLTKGAKKMEAEGVQHVSDNGSAPAHLRKVELDLSPCGLDAFEMGGLGLFTPPPMDVLFGIGALVYSFFAAEEWC